MELQLGDRGPFFWRLLSSFREDELMARLGDKNKHYVFSNIYLQY